MTVKILVAILLFFTLTLSSALYYQSYQNDKINKERAIYQSFIEYHRLASQDPILALPGIDTNELAKAVDKLLEHKETLQPFFSDSDLEFLNKNLYTPLFIQSLPILENTRRNFIDNPSLKLAHDYHNHLIKSLVYRKSYLEVFIEYFSNKPNIEYYMLDGKYNLTDIVIILKDEITATSKHIELEKLRFGCITNPTDCPVNGLGINYPKIEINHSSSSDIALSNKSIFEFEKFIINYYNSVNTTNYLSIDSKAVCSLNGNETIYSWHKKLSRLSELKTIRFNVVNDLYFYDTYALKESGDYSSIFEGSGRYSFQPTNTYMCFRFNEDVGRLYTAYEIINQIKDQSLTSNISESASRQKIVDIEQTLITTKEKLNVDLVEEYISLLEENLEAFPAQEEAKRIILLWRSKSPSLPIILGIIDDIAPTDNYVLEKTKLELPFFLMSRGYIPATLLFNNQTLTQNLIQIEPVSENNLDDFRLSSFSNDISQLTNLEELIDHSTRSN